MNYNLQLFSAFFKKNYEAILQLFSDGLQSSNNVVKISVFLILFANILTILILSTLFFNRLIRDRKKNRKRIIRQELDNLLSEVLYEELEIDSNEWRTKIKSIEAIVNNNYFKKSFDKNIFRIYLIQLKKTFTGNASNLIDDIYRHFKLDKYSLELLTHPSWSKRCQGLIEVATMKIKVDKKILSKLLNEQNLIVAMEAEITQLQIEPNNPFRFLDEAEIEMSEWHQVRLMHVIKDIPVATIPDFSKWINHPLTSVKIFCLRMISEYNQYENSEKVSSLLENQNEKVIYNALITLSNLGNCDYNKKIIQFYPSYSIENKIEVLKTFGKLCDEDSFDFLCLEFQSDKFELAFQSAESLHQFGPKGLEHIQKSAKYCSPMLNSIIEHILNPLLNLEN